MPTISIDGIWCSRSNSARPPRPAPRMATLVWSDLCIRRSPCGRAVLLTGFGKTISAQQSFDRLHIRDKRRTPPQDAQKGRPARAQQAKRRCVLCSVRGASERSENAAGGLFQHPADAALLRMVHNRSLPPYHHGKPTRREGWIEALTGPGPPFDRDRGVGPAVTDGDHSIRSVLARQQTSG